MLLKIGRVIFYFVLMFKKIWLLIRVFKVFMIGKVFVFGCRFVIVKYVLGYCWIGFRLIMFIYFWEVLKMRKFMIVIDIKIYVRIVDFMNIIKFNKSVELFNICF